MNLTQFINDELTCPELREKVRQFLSLVRHNIITEFACPVCKEDLRQTYGPHQKTQGRGNCVMCKLGIQMQHWIRHEGHKGCEVQLTYPVSLCDPALTKLLREAWVKTHGETLKSVQIKLTSEKLQWDQTAWIHAAQEIQETYNSRRRPKT